MLTPAEICSKAKSLIDTSPKESLQLYRHVWDIEEVTFNEWDSFFAIKAMRKSKTIDLEWAREIFLRAKDERVNNLFAWLVFDHIKSTEGAVNIKVSLKLLKLLHTKVGQKESNQDKYPCPFTLAVWQFAKNHPDHPEDILEVLSLIDSSKLSKTSETKTKSNNLMESYPSELEKHLVLMSKVTLSAGRFDDCILACQQGLSSIKDFHYNNDLWFKMRKSRALNNLLKFDEAKNVLLEAIQSKSGQGKWFLYKDLAEIEFSLGNLERSWAWSLRAALMEKTPEYLLKVLLLQIEILHKLQRTSCANKIAHLYTSIMQRNAWPIKDQIQELLKNYPSENNDTVSTEKVLAEVKDFWRQERYKEIEFREGRLVSLSRSGKTGTVALKDKTHVKFIADGLTWKNPGQKAMIGDSVKLYCFELSDHRILIERMESLSPIRFKPGEKVKGKIKRVMEFGAFVSIPGKPDGLIPAKLLKESRSHCTVGEDIEVHITGQSPKGLELKPVMAEEKTDLPF